MVFVWKNTLINHCGEAELLGQGKAETQTTINESQSALCENEQLPRQHLPPPPSPRQNGTMQKTIPSVGEDAEQREFSHNCYWENTLMQPLGEIGSSYL